jgi:hypothetical protein
MGFTIDTNNYCLANPLVDDRDQEDHVAWPLSYLRVIPRGMDWAVPPPTPRRSLVHFNVQPLHQEKARPRKWY